MYRKASLSLPIPEPTLFSSVEELFVREHILPDIITRDESSCSLGDLFFELVIDGCEIHTLETIPIWRIGHDGGKRIGVLVQEVRD